MKETVFLLILALVLSLCGCASGTPAAQTDSPPPSAAAEPAEDAPQAEVPADEEPAESSTATWTASAPSEEEGIPLYGTYNLYSLENAGQTMKPSEMAVAASLTLNEDGTGTMTMNGEESALAKWEEADGTVTLYNSNGEPLECSLEDGILRMEMWEDYYWFFAHEKTGLSDPDAGKQFKSMLYAFFTKIDGSAGAHLNYENHSEYLDSTSVFDVHAKDGVFYSERITRVDSGERLTANLFKDGTAYVLYPDEKKGNVATSTSAGTGDVLMLDELYRIMRTAVQRGDYTVEKRELNGTVYNAEVFPETEFSAETVFYFDDSGMLAHVREGAPKASPDLGETFYTIHSVDGSADESLFDISDYTIKK